MRTFACLAMILLIAPLAAAAGDTSEELLKAVSAALRQGRPAEALAKASEAVRAAPDSARAHFVRGVCHEALRKPEPAREDFDRALGIDPKLAEAYDHRGSANFLTGRIRESAADFDRYLELRPDERPGHWRRGITLYYAGRYEDGAAQFAAYEKVDTNDVENAVWHLLCNARVMGVDKARAKALKIGRDRRVPMTEVYELFLGKVKPEGVLAAANAGEATAAERKQRLNFAHLYLGLYHEMVGDAAKSREHMARAAGEYAAPNYMGDVARVHHELRDKERKGGGKGS